MNLFQPLLLVECLTFCCFGIFFMFHLSNTLRKESILINPSEYQQKIRDLKLDDILNNTHRVTYSTIKRIYNRALNKHFLIPYCGWISFVNLCIFITLVYLESKHIL